MIMHKTEQEQIRAILVQAIANICRKGLTYRKNFSIDGLLGITLDDDEIFLLNIKETIHNSSYLLSTSRAKAAVLPSPSLATTLKQNTTSKQKDAAPTPEVETQITPSPRRGKRRSSGGTALSEPGPKKSSAIETPDKTLVKPEIESEEEELEVVSVNGTGVEVTNGQQPAHLIIKPVKKRSLWGRSRRAKSRKSVPVRAVPVEASQPVFPEQDATDLGHFLSMKPMLRDIDEISNASDEQKDDASNQSAPSLQIDTGSNGRSGDGAQDSEYDDGKAESTPHVYIDHCVDGELSDVLNITGESETGDSAVAAMVFNDADGYQCGLCEEIFDDQIACRRHMRQQHKAKVSYTCELCGRRFWHHSDYNEHKAVFHEGPGGYPCQHCGKVLLSKRGIKEHTQHHTGQFPYFCVHCSRGFARKFEYTGHMRKNHPDDLDLDTSSVLENSVLENSSVSELS